MKLDRERMRRFFLTLDGGVSDFRHGGVERSVEIEGDGGSRQERSKGGYAEYLELIIL